MSDCYIYYRIAVEREQLARTALRTMLAELEASTQIVGHAYSKMHEPLLWMEVYTGVADAAGNAGAGSTDSNNYAIDSTRPTASIVVADTSLTAGETSLVTVTFSEAVELKLGEQLKKCCLTIFE